MNTTTMRYIARRQRRDDLVALVDVARSFRADILRAAGGEPAHLLLAQPETPEAIDEIAAALARAKAVAVIVFNGGTCSAQVRQVLVAAGVEIVEVAPPPTFNLYSQAPGWDRYIVCARGASAKNCVDWICAHANHGDGERMFRAFRTHPLGGEEFVCAWIVQGGSGASTAWRDVSVPREYV